MNITIINNAASAVPFSSSDGKGIAVMIDPGASFTVDTNDVTVANIGDNPSALEEFGEGMKNLLEQLGKFLAFWRDHAEAQTENTAADSISVHIKNSGTNGLRVLLGSNLNEVHVGAGGEYDAKATGYIEIRELGV